MENVGNDYTTTVNGAINNSVTSLVVTSASGVPTAPFRIRIDSEVLLVTAVSGTTYTITRGEESTSAASHADGAMVYHVVTAQGLANFVTSGIGKNAIINGDMEIAQRGTSFVAAASGTYFVDRWRLSKVGAAVHTVTQDTDVPTVAQAGRLFTHSLKFALTTADTSIAAGDSCYLGQRIEGYNWRALAQRPTTISFWIKSPITGIHCVALQNSAADRSCVKEYTVLATNTWEKKTLTFPASPAAGTWDYTTGIGVLVNFVLAAGSNVQGTADSWQSADIIATSGQVNGVNTGITPYFFTGVQLEAGSYATEFEGRTVQQELMLCERYLPSTGAVPGDATFRPIGSGYCYSTTQFAACFTFRVMPRIPPTGATVSDGAHFAVTDIAANAVQSVTLSVTTASQNAATLIGTVTAGLVQGTGAILGLKHASAQILFTGCEL